MATIQDIARMSGYSIGTVSRVINGRSGVSEQAREKIEEIIREQAYQPNSNARMLRQSVSSEISIIVRGISNTFLQSILELVQIRLREYGESANVTFIRDTDYEVSAAMQVLQRHKPKGLIFLGGTEHTFQKDFSQITIPSVLITADAERFGFINLSSFTTDDKAAAAYAVSKLIEEGHRRIGILGGYPEDAVGEIPGGSIVALRIHGAVEEMERNGITFDFDRDYEGCPFTGEGGYHAAEKLLSRTPDLTGIFGVSDSVALGAIRAFQDRGLRVPDDMSVVGFDGVVFSKYSVPRLSTIGQDIEMLAKKGVDDLLMRISYEGPAVHEKIPYLFVKGESVARPRE